MWPASEAFLGMHKQGVGIFIALVALPYKYYTISSTLRRSASSDPFLEGTAVELWDCGSFFIATADPSPTGAISIATPPAAEAAVDGGASECADVDMVVVVVVSALLSMSMPTPAGAPPPCIPPSGECPRCCSLVGRPLPPLLLPPPPPVVRVRMRTKVVRMVMKMVPSAIWLCSGFVCRCSRPGKTCLTKGLRQGRQAQIMPVYISMTLIFHTQVSATARLPQEGRIWGVGGTGEGRM